MLIDARAAYRRLRELSKDFDRREPRLTMPRPEGRLAADSVSYRAPGSDKLILFNIAFSLAPGEALAIIGPSAAGKSTLARLLTGVWAPTTGAVRLDGADVAYWPRQDLGPWIGYVPQDVELFDGSVADNIARLGKVDSEAVVAAAKRANAHEMILDAARRATTRRWENKARACLPASASALRSPARCTAIHGWWCSMSRTPTSTARARSRSPKP